MISVEIIKELATMQKTSDIMSKQMSPESNADNQKENKDFTW